MWRVLAADCAAFGIPSAAPPPLTRLGGGVSSEWVPAGSSSPRGSSASRWRFPRAVAGTDVVVTGDLQAPVLTTLAELRFTTESAQRRYSHSDFGHFEGSKEGVMSRVNPRPLVLKCGRGWTWAHARLNASRLVENSPIRSICAHVRCCGRRVGSKGFDPGPISDPDLLRLWYRNIRIEVGFGFASGEYEE